MINTGDKSVSHKSSETCHQLITIGDNCAVTIIIIIILYLLVEKPVTTLRIYFCIDPNLSNNKEFYHQNQLTHDREMLV